MPPLRYSFIDGPTPMAEGGHRGGHHHYFSSSTYAGVPPHPPLYFYRDLPVVFVTLMMSVRAKNMVLSRLASSKRTSMSIAGAYVHVHRDG